MWLTQQEGAHVDVAAPVGGKLRVGFHAGVLAGDTDYSVAFTQLAYDLRGDAVAVRVDAVDSAWRSSLAVGELGADRPQIGIGTEGSSLIGWTLDPPTERVVFESRRYDPATDLYWRIRESGGRDRRCLGGRRDRRRRAEPGRGRHPGLPIAGEVRAVLVIEAAAEPASAEIGGVNQ